MTTQSGDGLFITTNLTPQGASVVTSSSLPTTTSASSRPSLNVTRKLSETRSPLEREALAKTSMESSWNLVISRHLREGTTFGVQLSTA